MIDVDGLVREPLGERRAGPGVGLPHRQMHQHMRVERGDDIDDSLAIAGLDEVELAAAQPPSWRVVVNAKDRAHPGLGFEQ